MTSERKVARWSLLALLVALVAFSPAARAADSPIGLKTVLTSLQGSNYVAVVTGYGANAVFRLVNVSNLFDLVKPDTAGFLAVVATNGVATEGGAGLSSMDGTDYVTLTASSESLDTTFDNFRLSWRGNVIAYLSTNTTAFPSNLSASAITLLVDDAFTSAWNGSLTVPTKNAVHDQFVTLSNVLAGIAAGFTMRNENDSLVASGRQNVTLTNGLFFQAAGTGSNPAMIGLSAINAVSATVSGAMTAGTSVNSASNHISGNLHASAAMLTNGLSFIDRMMVPASNLTNFTLVSTNAESTINHTNAVRFTLLTGGVAGIKSFPCVSMTNYTASAQTLAFTNTWKALGSTTNSIAAGKVCKVCFEVQDTRVWYWMTGDY